jgi:hypothetical protein
MAFAVAAEDGGEGGGGGGGGRGHNRNKPGGYVATILEHAQDLQIAAEQATKLKALQDEIKTQFETLSADPGYQDLQAKIKEAHQSHNQDDLKSLNKQKKDLTAKTAPSVDQEHHLANAILTKEQASKLANWLKPNRKPRGAPGGGTDTGGNTDAGAGTDAGSDNK